MQRREGHKSVDQRHDRETHVRERKPSESVRSSGGFGFAGWSPFVSRITYHLLALLSLGLGTLLAATMSYYYIASAALNSSANERPRLWEFDVPGSGVPSTYLQQPKSTYTIAESKIRGYSGPDTTAVVLNWSRLKNVILIAELLCGPWLDDTIVQVFIWNNNPNFTLAVEDFSGTGCSGEKLHIHNSQSNMYFVARYLACAEAQTPYCFVQDDDYLVRPEVIRNMHKTISQSSTIQSLHLLPAHERLLSRLHTVTTIDKYITTAFIWLGHGTYLNRSSVKDFLHLLQDLKLTDEEMKMADNYFTILSNRHKQDEVWFDHGIELGGGQPFTIGTEGDARNERHMTQALSYLSSSISDRGGIAANNPYISKADVPRGRVNRAPCRLAFCVLESNIELLQDTRQTEVQAAEDMVSESRKRWLALGEERRQWYIKNSPSTMVDGRPETAFHSREEARMGDWITMDAMEILDLNERELELSFLVSAETEQLFRDCTFSTSTDGNHWIDFLPNLTCLLTGQDGGARGDTPVGLKECSVKILNEARYYRVMYAGSGIFSKRFHWVIHEMWLRYVLP